jgi:hypothetical protein
MNARELHSALMACESKPQVVAIAARHITGRPIAGVDVSGLLSDTARTELGLPTGCCTLGRLVRALIIHEEDQQ